jgi:iron complex outermembrane receptor protein
VKLLASYDFGQHFQLSGEVDNLFNSHYYLSSYSRLWITPGSPRAFTARLSYRF